MIYPRCQGRLNCGPSMRLLARGGIEALCALQTQPRYRSIAKLAWDPLYAQGPSLSVNRQSLLCGTGGFVR